MKLRMSSMQRHSGAKNHLQQRTLFLWEIEWLLSKMADIHVFQMVLSRVQEDHGKSLSPREAQPGIRKMMTMMKCQTGKGGECNPSSLSPTDQILMVEEEEEGGEEEGEGEEDVGVAEEDGDDDLIYNVDGI